MDTVSRIIYINEGTAISPYWTPIHFEQKNLLGACTDFRSGTGVAVAGTNMSEIIADGTGVRVHGQGVADTDSGLTVAFGEGEAIASLVTTDEDAHLACLSCLSGNATVPYQPDTHGVLNIDATIAMSAAITLRRLFIGFLGTLADALDPPVTGAGVTATLVQDDLAGMGFDVGFTDADRLYAFHNKSDAAASQDVSAAARDTLTDFPAAGTYTRLRVEISGAGVMTLFKDKAMIHQIGTIAAPALDVDEECGPALLVGSTSAATKTMLIKQFAAWATRS
jgi:hypothetical protein